DLSNLTLYTQAKIEILQPVFTWGALKNAVKASRAGAEASLNKFEITQNKTAFRLYKLYQSYLLSLEISFILDEAQDKLENVIAEFEKARKEEDSELSESDLFQLKVFQSEFGVRSGEVHVNADYIQQVWNFVLGDETADVVYMPDTYFLDPVENSIKSLTFYKERAVSERPEVLALNEGIQAAKYGLEATKAKNLPALFVGFTGTYIHTPNPPLGSYAFKFDETNFAEATLGIGFRQNLDFWGMKFDVDKSKIQLKKAKYSKQAATQGIILDLMEKYKDASASKIEVEKLREAHTTAKRWLRQEQLDYDLGTVNTKDLIDALKKELMLRVQLKQAIYDFNVNMAELYKASAIPVVKLKTDVD
ncbi:MAG TPA: TolC family protein, partial [Balneolaceae bacterium]|nr:TolC family protein [Balneolaceae bacterium]